jgi:diacylglycerol kinase (ATP)
MKVEPARLRRYAASFRHAIEGVLDAYRSQRHMRVHFLFMGLNGILALIYKLTSMEVAVLMLCITMVVFAEMINTVVEATLNIITETYHPIARFAKDVAAGAVLVTALNACLVGVCIYFNPDRINRVRQVWVVGNYADDSAMLRALAMSVLLLVVVVTAIKVGRPQASVLQGGPVSGYTAIAFCLATCLFFMIRDAMMVSLAVVLAAALAVLAAYPRLHDHNRRLMSVVYGAALGTLIPLLVFQLLARPPR